MLGSKRKYWETKYVPYGCKESAKREENSKANFSFFLRLDSCLTSLHSVRQSKSRKMENLSRHGKLPERFSSEE